MKYSLKKDNVKKMIQNVFNDYLPNEDGDFSDRGVYMYGDLLYIFDPAQLTLSIWNNLIEKKGNPNYLIKHHGLKDLNRKDEILFFSEEKEKEIETFSKMAFYVDKDYIYTITEVKTRSFFKHLIIYENHFPYKYINQILLPYAFSTTKNNKIFLCSSQENIYVSEKLKFLTIWVCSKLNIFDLGSLAKWKKYKFLHSIVPNLFLFLTASTTPKEKLILQNFLVHENFVYFLYPQFVDIYDCSNKGVFIQRLLILFNQKNDPQEEKDCGDSLCFIKNYFCVLTKHGRLYKWSIWDQK